MHKRNVCKDFLKKYAVKTIFGKTIIRKYYKVFAVMSDISIVKTCNTMKKDITVAKWILSGANGIAFRYADAVLDTVSFFAD